MGGLLYQQPTGGKIVTDTTEDQNITDHIAAIHTQLNDIATILTDCNNAAKNWLNSRFPNDSIPYYKLALQSQRQFCQTVKTLNDLTSQKNNKQKQDV